MELSGILAFIDACVYKSRKSFTDVTQYALKARKNICRRFVAPRELADLEGSAIDDLIGCTVFQGSAKTAEEMEGAIRQGVNAEWGKHDSD